MRHGLLALAVLLNGFGMVALAEYVRFSYNPGVLKSGKPNDPNAKPPGEIRPGVFGEGQPGQPAAKPPEEDLDLSAIRDIIVEVDKIVPVQRFQTLGFHHRWGQTLLIQTDDIKCARVMDGNLPIPTCTQKYDLKRKEFQKKKPTPEQLLELAEFALVHGLVDKCADDLKELLKTKADHPVAKAFADVQKNLGRALKGDDDSDVWKGRLATYKVVKSDHYALFTNAQAGGPEVESVLKRVESNFRAYYFWFALRAISLPMPERRLVLVLSDKAEDFHQLHQVFDAPPLSTDGFYSRRDDLGVLSATSMDEAYDSMSKATRDMWVNKGWNRDTLLKGVFKVGETPEASATAQVLALLLRAMQEEAELAAVSQVASRQLATASGLLPRSVAVPEWVQSGVGSFFETPNGAYWSGTGAPHWKYLMKFKIWRDNKKGGDTIRFATLDRPEEALRKAVTDQYFRAAHEARDPNAMLQARTMAWSLTYFLAQRQLDGFLRYCQELNNLPRDIEFDDSVLLGCFARAFKVVDPAKPAEFDQARFKKLAVDWYRCMDDTQLEVPEVWNLAKKQEESRLKKLAHPDDKGK